MVFQQHHILLLKLVIDHLRSLGLRNIIYLDDLCCLGESYEQCLENVCKTINLLECLGFIINKEKSKLIPCQLIEYLRFLIDLQKMIFIHTPKRSKSLLSWINKFLQLRQCTIREFATLLGKLVPVCMAVSYGFLYTKILEREKCLALKKYNESQ